MNGRNAIKTIDLTATRLDTMLIHALNNTGKTTVLAAMLERERSAGPCLYAGMAGEPYGPLASYDMSGVDLREFESIEDILKFTKDMQPYHAVALDSIQRLAELANTKVTEGKYIVGAKEDHGKDWAKLKYEIFNVIEALKRKAALFVAVCPSNTHENQITHAVRTVPDVPGVSEKIVGRFNFAGYLEATPISPTQTQRKISFHTMTNCVTRWNAKKALKEAIKLPDKGNVWVPIRDAVEAAIRGE